MIDLLFLAKGREEFTEVSLKALGENTNWDLVNSFRFYADGSGATTETFGMRGINIPVDRRSGYVDCAEYGEHIGGPVAIMNHALKQPGSDIWMKCDNDVIVPPGWLEAALSVMQAHPELEFLGLEPPASRTANPATGKLGPVPEFPPLYSGNVPLSGYAKCDSIGGVGLMRRSAFANRPPMIPSGPRGVGGFTQWQIDNKVRAGWIVPPLKLFLLDRLPFEPWLSLSKRYIAANEQRPWTLYDPRDTDKLWGWWLK